VSIPQPPRSSDREQDGMNSSDNFISRLVDDVLSSLEDTIGAATEDDEQSGVPSSSIMADDDDDLPALIQIDSPLPATRSYMNSNFPFSGYADLPGPFWVHADAESVDENEDEEDDDDDFFTASDDDAEFLEGMEALFGGQLPFFETERFRNPATQQNPPPSSPPRPRPFLPETEQRIVITVDSDNEEPRSPSEDSSSSSRAPSPVDSAPSSGSSAASSSSDLLMPPLEPVEEASIVVPATSPLPNNNDASGPSDNGAVGDTSHQPPHSTACPEHQTTLNSSDAVGGAIARENAAVDARVACPEDRVKPDGPVATRKETKRAKAHGAAALSPTRGAHSSDPASHRRNGNQTAFVTDGRGRVVATDDCSIDWVASPYWQQSPEAPAPVPGETTEPIAAERAASPSRG